MLKKGEVRRNPVSDIHPLSHEEIHDLLVQSEKYENKAKFSEIGLWAKYKTSMHDQRKYGAGQRAYLKTRIYRWIEEKLIRF